MNKTVVAILLVCFVLGALMVQETEAQFGFGRGYGRGGYGGYGGYGRGGYDRYGGYGRGGYGRFG